MLTKVDQLAHIGRFQILQHRAEGFKRLALLFARNGYGKSTICAVLRSAATQSPRLIAEREHLGNAGIPSATIQFAPAKTVAFNNGSWNSSPPPILLFDQEYVKTHIHVAEEVTTDNRRRMLRVIIGSTGVELARQLDALEKENDELNAQIRTLETSIRKAGPDIRDVETFVNAVAPENIDAKIAEAKRVVRQGQRRSEIVRRPALFELFVGAHPETYLDLLAAGFDGALAAAEIVVSEHIKKHDFDDNARRWLNYGVKHADGEDCPFCDQSLRPSATADALRLLYGAESGAVADRIELACRLTTAALQGQTALDHLHSQNEINFEFWQSVVHLEPFITADSLDIRHCMEVVSWMAAALKQKSAEPARSMDVPSDRAIAWNALLRAMTNYNHKVTATNAAISALKESDAVAGQSNASAETIQLKWEALKKRDDSHYGPLCEKWKVAQRRRGEIAVERTAKQATLRDHTKHMADDYEESINLLLESFGANFRFCQAKANYVGGANVQYCININGHALNVSDSSRKDRPSFKTALSSGDKMSLALALFVTQVKNRTDISDLVIVLDDPFTSQDSGRQFETSARIRELSALAAQVIVLSHDARFLGLIQKDANPTDCSEHQIRLDADRHGVVCAWSAQSELKSDYVRRAERIRGYANTGVHLSGCSATMLASDLRVFMEEYLDQRFPGRFAPRTLLGGMIDAIDECPNDPLHPERLSLREINEFSRPEHHRGTEGPDPTQLQAQCKKIVRIIGTY